MWIPAPWFRRTSTPSISQPLLAVIAPGLRAVAELLHGEVPDLHAGAARDAAAGDRELELPPGRVVGQVDPVRPVVPEELAWGQLSEGADLPQARIVQEHLVPVDAHALGVAALHRAALAGGA